MRSCSHSEPAGVLVLVASANPSYWHRIKAALRDRFVISYAVNLSGTIDAIQRHRPAVAILCSSLLDASLHEALSSVKKRIPDAKVIAVAASGEAFRSEGEPRPQADAFLDDTRIAGSLLQVVCSLLQGESEEGGGQEETCIAESKGVPPGSPDADGLAAFFSDHPVYRPMVVGASQQMKTLVQNVRRVAPIDVNVLISGESGTGKEVLARLIHCCSRRAPGPFETVDLPSIPDELFASILFGHERGSFTGAVSSNQGKFQRAEQGTLFLDEISSLKLELQPKLLRVLQEKEVECVGGRRPISCDVRVIAATNADLEAAVRRGRFRTDLFYRLNVVVLRIPPLRERREDIKELLGFFLKKHAKELGCDPPQVSAQALQALEQHEWPGNIRELQNLVQRAMLLSASPKLEAEDFFRGRDLSTPADPSISFGDCTLSLAEVERRYINHIIDKTDGNQSQAAKILQINRKTLRSKLQTNAEDPARTGPALRSVS